METLPIYISVVFALTTLLAVWLFFRAAHFSKYVLALSLAWLAAQGGLALTGFYTVTNTLPPRMLLLVLPPLLLIAILFATSRGRQFIDGLDTGALTLLHLVRVPVEVVLFWLFLGGVVPELMTFEGRNFDVLSGLSAPVVYYLGYRRNSSVPKGFLLAWNFLCLGLLLNIVINGILSIPTPFQQFAFNQPNVALLYFPFVWLPCFIVPVVFFSHLATIKQLLAYKGKAAGNGIDKSGSPFLRSA
ncbi:hypothetical protein [Pontibacter chinhatensis]|uniref:Uncharacterized protein n=1 Tax=Pontibacter chinhatensis TaxID=1436961 RepID=A0A1I2ZFI8_9BACT|nr:hypothetical protein [Pontibacter chinhatensis]SFH36279.1 hypothetical protein SAMN05421739_11345 [Pontibacter chinhatensis]